MAKVTKDDVLEWFGSVSVLELSEFKKEFEEKFDVTAAAPVAVAAAAPVGDDAPAEEEKDEFDVVITVVGDKKIAVIKEVRSLTSLGLKEAKEVVDNAPGTVIEAADKESADKAKEALEAAGATVELR